MLVSVSLLTNLSYTSDILSTDLSMEAWFVFPVPRSAVSPAVISAVVVTHGNPRLAPVINLLLNLELLLLHDLLEGVVAVLPQLDPLVCVANTGVLYQGSEHHEEAGEEVNVDGLHVGDLGQGGVDRVDEGGHGEHSGHSQPHPGGGRPSVEPE